MSEHFDIAVLGTGPGGYIAALKAAQMGAKTAVVEQHPFFGGTCLNWGCIPSKALLASAEMIHNIREKAPALGIQVNGTVGFDWSAIQKRKDKVVQTLRTGVKNLFAARGVTSFQGRATLDGPGRVAVLRDGAKADEFTATKIILAVGSLPTTIPGWPSDKARICTSDESLHWSELPRRLLIVGGGVIGCEFACMMQPFGVEVTVVEMMPKLLPGMDGQLADALAKVLQKRGVKIFTDTKVDDLTLAGDAVAARLTNGQSIQADRVLVATGRRPATADLGLESIGLATDRGFIRVSDRMETSVKDVYCIGDANGRCLLAHAASAQGVAAVENALGHPRDFTDAIPATVYTFPEIAAVGLTQDQAREKEIPVAVGAFPLSALGKAMSVADAEGFIKLIRHRESDELLGVHMMGHNVTEVIAAASALLNRKISTRAVAETVFSHPTISEALREAAEDALGMCLHLPPRKVVRVKV